MTASQLTTMAATNCARSFLSNNTNFSHYEIQNGDGTFEVSLILPQDCDGV